MMRRMDAPTPDLRIPKLRVRVELCVVGHAPQDAEIFVAENEEHAWRRQDVRDLLERAPNFLPARDASRDEWVVTNKDALLWLRLVEPPPGEDPFFDAETLFELQRAVRVDLTNGTTLDGDLLYSPAPGHGRVADYLNEPGRFFALWTNAGQAFVNKAHVASVREDAASR
jgi:hypothetical protein